MAKFTVPCRKCSSEIEFDDDSVTLGLGDIAKAACLNGECDGTAIITLCQSCGKSFAPRSFQCNDCASLAASSETQAPAVDQVDSHVLLDEMRLEFTRLKKRFDGLESMVSESSTLQRETYGQTTERLRRVRDGLSKNIADAHSEILKTQKALVVQSEKLEKAGQKIDNAALSNAKAIQDSTRVVTDVIAQNQAHDDNDTEVALLAVAERLSERLDQLRCDFETMQVLARDALKGPKDRPFENLNHMIHFWVKRSLSEFRKAIADAPQDSGAVDMSPQTSVGEESDSRNERQALQIDLSGMEQLLAMFRTDTALRLIQDLPELFNSVDDQLRENRRTLAETPGDPAATQTVESLERIRNRMSAWQDQNDLVKIPREENENVDPRYHFPVGRQSTSDPELDRRIYEVKSMGYLFHDGDNELVLQKAEVIVWEYVADK